MKRLAQIKLPENTVLNQSIISSFFSHLPRDASIYMIDTMGDWSKNSSAPKNVYLRFESSKFKEVEESQVIPDIKVTFNDQGKINSFDMSQVLEQTNSVIFPSGSVINSLYLLGIHKQPASTSYQKIWTKMAVDSMNYGSGKFILNWDESKLNSTLNTHQCTFDQQYTGLVEHYTFCKCGKKA